MSKFVYNRGLYEVASQNIDLVNDTIKALILSDSGTQNQDNDYVSDVSANEVSGTTYSRATLANVGISLDDTYDKIYITSDDINFGNVNVTQTMKYIEIFKDTGDDSTSPLICSFIPDAFPASGTGQYVVISMPQEDVTSNTIFYIEAA